MYGYLGYLQFTTHDKCVQAPENLERTVQGRWETVYPNDGSRPRRIFRGADVGGFTFDMHLHQFYNEERISDILDQITNWVNTGYAQELVIGSKPFGYNKWIIKKAVLKYQGLTATGEIYYAVISVTLEEY
ncbi:MAG: phage tail protein [Candidatus Ornithomonoglobus sp.]